MDFSPRNVVSADVGSYLSRTEFIANPDRDETVTVHTTRFDGLVDMAKELSNAGIHGSKEMRLVGIYPPHMPEYCCNAWGISWEEFWSDPKWIKKMLADPALSAFRIAPGTY